VRTIVVADFVMSIDNVVGVAAAARGDLRLMALGLLFSVPVIVLGSSYLIRFIGRFPIVVVLGAGLLGWVGGETAAHDPVMEVWSSAHTRWVARALPPVLALTVVILGIWMRRRRPVAHADVTSVPHPRACDSVKASPIKPSAGKRQGQ
jgi:predicted tellurium resistance membrane protein TerC